MSLFELSFFLSLVNGIVNAVNLTAVDLPQLGRAQQQDTASSSHDETASLKTTWFIATPFRLLSRLLSPLIYSVDDWSSLNTCSQTALATHDGEDDFVVVDSNRDAFKAAFQKARSPQLHHMHGPHFIHLANHSTQHADCVYLQDYAAIDLPHNVNPPGARPPDFRPGFTACIRNLLDIHLYVFQYRFVLPAAASFSANIFNNRAFSASTAELQTPAVPSSSPTGSARHLRKLLHRCFAIPTIRPPTDMLNGFFPGMKNLDVILPSSDQRRIFDVNAFLHSSPSVERATPRVKTHQEPLHISALKMSPQSLDNPRLSPKKVAPTSPVYFSIKKSAHC
ncbi:hypothetical protein BCR43DRAFT_565088 [Syncephalastrum racemosum]|uniref:Uncharacterized protein n=1 Tax=Syncephalastrum racemosum TaxID=13706 RepID=A0A1X2H8L5_SYNRA|nr:hypothetical protein BCR43DRAFT_565088 [Syncephalastrum racemosum]